MKNQTLIKKARETLNNKVIPEVLRLKKILSKGKTEKYSLNYPYVSFFINEENEIVFETLGNNDEICILKCHCLNFCEIEIANDNLMVFCETFEALLNNLKLEEEYFLNFIKNYKLIKKELLIEKNI